MHTTSLSPFGVLSAEASLDHSAPWSKVHFAPPAAWVETGTESYDALLKARDGDQVTRLLMARQVKARTGRVYQSNAVRLETNQAAVRESQWSVQLDPRTQTLTLHWIRVVRAGQSIDHLDREHIRLIQRETQSERILMDGHWTLLVVLEDLRPGDILETAFTYETTDLTRPQSTEMLFAVPPQEVVGRYRLSVQSVASDEELRWKASGGAPEFRETKTDDTRRNWVWEGSQLVPRSPEANQLSWCMDYVWIQVSDLAGWSDLSGRIAAAWEKSADSAGLEETPAFVRPENVTAGAVAKLIQFLQDEFRYVTLSGGSDGRIPASPATVARRRYGDCKDLVWLAVTVLRRWGVEARPVFVSDTLKAEVASLLPALVSLDRVVLEVIFEGAIRWFDLANRSQGGDFKTQPVTWFGQGLPIDLKAPALRAQSGERSRAVKVFKETVLLESRLGEPSLAEHHIWVEGAEADKLRHQYAMLGFEEFTRAQEQAAQHRYGKATRVGELKWRDDRDKNTCELVEVFSIQEAVVADPNGRRGFFEVPPNLIAQAFPLPEIEPRRTAWALPYPLELRHEIIVKNMGMPHGNRRRRRWVEEGFSASLDEPKLRGAWSKTVQFSVNAPAISVEQIEGYRKQLERFLVESLWRLYLPWNLPRGNRGAGFGELAPAGEARVPYVAPTVPDETIASLDLSGLPDALPEGRDGVQAIARPPAPVVLNVAEMKRGGASRRPQPVIPRPSSKLKMSTLAWGGLWVTLVLSMLYLLHVVVRDNVR